MEKNIIIIGNSDNLVTNMVINFASLLYPLNYIYTLIPLMTEMTLKFIQAEGTHLAFLYGMNRTFYENKLSTFDIEKEFYVYDIDNKEFNINLNLKNNGIKFSSPVIKKLLPNLPNSLETLLSEQLDIIKKNVDNSKYLKKEANLRIKNLFIYIFEELLKDFDKYCYFIFDYPTINQHLITELKSGNENEKYFYEAFTKNQSLTYFLENYLLDNKDTYFLTRLKKKKRSNEIEKSYEEFEKYYSNFYDISKIYIIQSEFVKNFKEKGDEDFNPKVFSSEDIIVKKSFELTNDNDPNNIDCYILPGQNRNSIEQNAKAEAHHLNTKEEDRKRKIRDDLRNFFVQLFSSCINEKTKKETLPACKSYMKGPFGRELFIDGVLNRNKVKYLEEPMYEIFLDFILKLLWILKDREDTKSAVNAIKGCFYIKKITKNDEKDLIKDLNEYFENYSLAHNYEFWKYWVEEEIKDMPKKIDGADAKKRRKKYIENDLKIIMKNMKFDSSFIKDICSKLINEK